MNLSLGLAFAICARDRVRADGPVAQPAFTLILLFLGLIQAPMTLYLYAAHPSWTWMYLVNPDAVPGFAILPLVVLHSGALLLGYYAGARLIIAGQLKIVCYLAGGGAGVSLLGVLVFWGRLGQYGSYAEFTDGRSIPIMDVKLGYVLVALAIGTIASAAFLAYELVRDGRRVRSR